MTLTGTFLSCRAGGARARKEGGAAKRRRASVSRDPSQEHQAAIVLQSLIRARLAASWVKACVFLVLACRAVRREVDQEQTAAARIQRHWRAYIEQRTLDAEDFELNPPSGYPTSISICYSASYRYLHHNGYA